MRFTASKKDLVKTLNLCMPSVGKTDMTSDVLIMVDCDSVTFRTTDTELTTTAMLEVARVELDGEASVDARHLVKIIKSLPDSPVLFDLTEDSILITAPPAKFSIKTTPEDSAVRLFSSKSEDRAISEIVTSAGELRSAIRHTIFAISRDENRYGLNGAHFEDVDGSLANLVTTEGTRLCRSSFTYTGDFGLGKNMLIPLPFLSSIVKILDTMGPEDDATIYFALRNFSIKAENITLETRLIDGEFPAYKSVIPKANEFKTVVTTTRTSVRDAFSRALVEATDQANTVKVEVNDSGMVVSSERVGGEGSLVHPISADVQGPDVTFGVNASMVTELMTCTGATDLEIRFKGTLDPIMLLFPELPGALFIIMPIRLD